MYFIKSPAKTDRIKSAALPEDGAGAKSVGREGTTHGETGVADLSPAEEVEEAMDAGQLTAHQPLTLRQGAGLAAVQVVDGRHHHHICRGTHRSKER